jgi:hypothetical protein
VGEEDGATRVKNAPDQPQGQRQLAFHAKPSAPGLQLPGRFGQIEADQIETELTKPDVN